MLCTHSVFSLFSAASPPQTSLLHIFRYVLPRREHAGYVEEELQQLVMMLRHAAGRDGDGNGDGGGGGGDSDGAVASAEPEAGLLAFDFDRLRGLGGSVLSAFPMLSGQRDIDPREL